MVTWGQLKEKFFDKGYICEFHFFIGTIPSPDFSRIIFMPEETQKDVLKRFHNQWEKLNQEQWNYWNTWIDYQKHK